MSLPIVALEGLSLLVEAAKEKAAAFGNVQRVYTHGQGFVNEGPGRVLLALLAEQGKRIVSIQHGALIYLAHPWMFLERNVADAYISWGSGYSHYDKLPGANNTKVLPSVHLSGLRRQASGGRRQKWDVLFVVLEEQRYTKWLYSPLFPDMARDYFSREKKLFDHFCVSKRAAVKVYSETFGWGQADWVKKRYPLAVLLSRGKFVDYAQQAKIVVVDYLSTAFLELLVLGRPFLATWNRRWFRGGDLFEKLLDRLAEAGVFHEQPESLIRSYAQTISPDIDRWWNESQRQGAVKEMADSFAMSSDTACEEWREEFQGESGWRGPSLERK